MKEKDKVEKLYRLLIRREMHKFPPKGKQLRAPSKQGVYIIYRKKEVLHVGRSVSGKRGLFQRLEDHLHGSSSFTKSKHPKLREKCSFKYIEIYNRRKRALLEALTIGKLCPKHIGLGRKR